MKQRSVALMISTIFLILAIDFIHGKPIRKLSPDTEYWYKFSNYLNDKKWPEGETYENYIILYYGQDVEYSSGFANGNRKNISRIMNVELETKAKDPLSISADTKVEIYFSSALTSLESFFDSSFDDKMKYLKSVDLSHLDATQITSFENLFYECSALKLVTPTKVPTLSLTTMKSMFDGCESIIYIDLSKYYTSLVTNMDFLFYRCNSLKAIDMSCISFQNLASIKSMFYGTDDLATFFYNDKIGSSPVLTQTFIELYSNGNLNLCIAPNCCDIVPENGECKISSNYITITYGHDA